MPTQALTRRNYWLEMQVPSPYQSVFILKPVHLDWIKLYCCVVKWTEGSHISRHARHNKAGERGNSTTDTVTSPAIRTKDYEGGLPIPIIGEGGRGTN